MFSLYDAGEIWIADLSDPAAPKITKFPNVGKQPYDALITPDGRYYIAGLFGEDGLALLDLWHPDKGVQRILEATAAARSRCRSTRCRISRAGDRRRMPSFLPSAGTRCWWLTGQDWQEVGRIPVHGQPVFAVARPDGRQVWVNFAHPDNDASR